MSSLPPDVAQFFQKQHFVVVATIDRNGMPHTSCKGIKIDRDGKIYILDLYKKRTLENVKHNPHISITAVDERWFMGYCLKGRAEVLEIDSEKAHLLEEWGGRLRSRVTHRLIKNVQGETGHPRHPEARLPKPEYLISMEVEEIVDLSPQHIKKQDRGSE